MAGPYPPHPPGGAEGQRFPTPPGYGGEPYPYPGVYPGPLPPPVGFVKPPGHRRALWWSLLAVALAGALVAAVLAAGGDRSTSGATGFTDQSAKVAIQGYLTAL